MAGIYWSVSETKLLIDLFNSGKSAPEIAKIIDRTEESVSQKLRKIGLSFKQRDTENFVIQTNFVPSANRRIVDLLEDRRKEFARKKAHHEGKKDISISLPDEPYGIFLFGDLHADDPGCDIDLAMAHMEIASETPGVYAINIGDISNNWIGSLARLYAKQATTDDEAASLVEWVMDSAPWIFTCLGNHDVWASTASYIAQKKGLLYASHGAKLTIQSGNSKIRIDARHDHKGRSQFNPSHGQLSQNYRGSDCDVIVAGHTHVSAYTLVRNGVSGKKAHCLRIGSYKAYDDFAESKHFSQDTLGPCAFLTVNTNKECDDPADKIHVWHDHIDGVKYLEALRCIPTNPSGKSEGESRPKSEPTGSKGTKPNAGTEHPAHQTTKRQTKPSP